ncbi:MAG: peptidoglycan-binding protein LysM [Hyphomicrobiales bacterium]
MGFFDFIKGVGEKIGIGSAEAAPAADDLKKEAEKLGLDTKGIEIKVEGDTVKISGAAASTADREKLILAMGNTVGVAKVEDAIEVAAAEPDAVFYTVQKGDNLWKIAEAHYGKGKGAQHTVIFEANKPMLSHPDKIYPGQVLRIPPLA